MPSARGLGLKFEISPSLSPVLISCRRAPMPAMRAIRGPVSLPSRRAESFMSAPMQPLQNRRMASPIAQVIDPRQEEADHSGNQVRVRIFPCALAMLTRHLIADHPSPVSVRRAADPALATVSPGNPRHPGFVVALASARRGPPPCAPRGPLHDHWRGPMGHRTPAP